MNADNTPSSTRSQSQVQALNHEVLALQEKLAEKESQVFMAGQAGIALLEQCEAQQSVLLQLRVILSSDQTTT